MMSKTMKMTVFIMQLATFLMRNTAAMMAPNSRR